MTRHKLLINEIKIKKEENFEIFFPRPITYITQHHEYFERKKKKKKITRRARINISLLSPFISTAVSTIPQNTFLPEKEKKKSITRSEFLLGANHSESFAATAGFRYAE